MPFTFGIIGAGHSAKNIISAAQEISDMQVIGVTSKPIAEAEKFAQTYQIEIVFPDYQTMLEDKNIDAVIVSVPHNLHYQIVLDALNAGKHVLCEKPLAISSAQGREMIQLAKEKNLRLGTFFQNRFNDSSLEAKKCLDSGKIGTVLHGQMFVFWSRNQAYYDESEWRGKWETEGGGLLINQAIHTIDLLIWLLGKPVKVFGMYDTKTHNIEVEDNAAAVAIFESGAYATLQGSTSTHPGYPATLRIFGTKGMIDIDGFHLHITYQDGTTESLDFKGERQQTTNDYKHNAKIRILNDFLGALSEDRPPEIDGYEGIRAIEVIEAIYSSKGKTLIHFNKN